MEPKSVVYSTEEPIKGKVNKEIIKELSKLFHTKAELVLGGISKQKQFFIRGMDKSRLKN